MTSRTSFFSKGALLFCLALLFMQCDKDEPSRAATLETTMGLFTNAAVQGKLTIDDAWIYATQLDIQADGTDGNRSDFSSANTNTDTKITLTGGENETPFLFDVTQGKYDRVTMFLSAQEDAYSLMFPNGQDSAPDFADFLVNGKPSLGFVGKFTNRGEAIRVVIAINITDRMSFQATQKSQPLVGMAKMNRAKISFDPAYILHELTTARLESAKIFEHQGQKTIFIHPQYNEALYLLLEERMFDANNFIKGEIIEINSNG